VGIGIGATLVALAGLGLAHACSTEQPAVGDAYLTPQYLHAQKNPTTCAQCHEPKRPAPPHDATGECAACHIPSDVSGSEWKRKPGVGLVQPAASSSP
jgi:hypothetical protein